jgi:Ca2+-binding RTX toxin-like protein
MATIKGTNLADTLYGTAAADSIFGFAGHDNLKGGGGADYLAGGAGIDTADYSQAPSSPDGIWGVIVNLSTNKGDFGDALDDTFSSIENLTGSSYFDVLYGNDAGNLIKGLDGNDQLFGYGGNDVLEGGNDNDVLDGGAGIDTMTGGMGSDTYHVDSASDVVDEIAGQGVSDKVLASASYALTATAEIEFMSTTDQNSAAAIDLSGNDVKQYMLANEGSNVLSGFGGNDTLDGRGGFDRLFGGDGDDVMIGDGGPDDLFGGTGADQFVYHLASQTGIVPGTFDVIHDFDRAQGDLINLGDMDANPGMAGVQDWTFVGATNSFTAPGQVGFASDGVDTFILFNNDNDAVHEATIRVLGLHNVDASWFVL